MSKDELQALAIEYDAEFMRYFIENFIFGLLFESDTEIPELEKIIANDCKGNPTPVAREYMPKEYGEKNIVYRVFTPLDWFDLYGWR